MKRRITYIAVSALFAAYIVAVLCLTLLDLSDKTPELPKYFLGIPMDKLAHFLMYFAYPITGWLMLSYNKNIKIGQKYIFSCLIISGLAFAAFTETAQGMFTTYRESDPLDFLANILGIFSGSLIIWLLRKPATKVCDAIQEYMHNRLHK